ncbi:hypothetical protein D3C85_1487310 [compost metagenome]
MQLQDWRISESSRQCLSNFCGISSATFSQEQRFRDGGNRTCNDQLVDEFGQHTTTGRTNVYSAPHTGKHILCIGIHIRLPSNHNRETSFFCSLFTTGHWSIKISYANRSRHP